MLILKEVSYLHPDHSILFEHINLTIAAREKIALIGNNGSGKSTLLQLIAGKRKPHSGDIILSDQLYYVPQIFGQLDQQTVAEVLGIDMKITALHAILDGATTEDNFHKLADDWTIEERCAEAFQYWELSHIDMHQKLGSLSGGQKTKVLLAGIQIHDPAIVLLDEPSNHLDANTRRLLYDFIENTAKALIIVSHDRQLLNLLPNTAELTNTGLQLYGGNYDFFQTQKNIEKEALSQNIQDREKALRKAKEIEREALERKQKLDARGKKKQEGAGVARIMMNTLRNNAESSTAKMRNAHSEKIGNIADELKDLRANIAAIDKMNFGLGNASLHKGKVLFVAHDINVVNNDHRLWKHDFSLQVNSGERIAIKGNNGSGKTTLIRMILKQLPPSIGQLDAADIKYIYIDQDYTQVNNQLSIYEYAQTFNHTGLEEHEIKIRLHRFLFTKNDWDKKCSHLSGGERMRLMLCCLTIDEQAPDLIVLDEPTNNLDIQNIEILTMALQAYQGTLLVISHDQAFLEQLTIQRTIELQSQPIP